MPLRRSPPPTPSVSVTPSESTEAATLQKNTQNFDSSALQWEPFLHGGSEPNLPALMLNITERKKRKFEEGNQMTMIAAIEKMFGDFSSKLESRIEGLQDTISIIKQQNIELTNSVDVMSNKHDEFLARITQLEADKKQDKKTIALLEDKLESMERKTRATGFEIRNVQKHTGETKNDLCNLVQKLGEVIKVDINPSDIKDIYRVNTKNSTLPIIVELTTVLQKEMILSELKKFNKNKPKGSKLNTSHLKLMQPLAPVYVTETLTAKAQRLFYLSREFQKSMGYSFCWTSHGVVYLRKDENSPQLRITCEDDIENLRKKA